MSVVMDYQWMLNLQEGSRDHVLSWLVSMNQKPEDVKSIQWIHGQWFVEKYARDTNGALKHNDGTVETTLKQITPSLKSIPPAVIDYVLTIK